MRILYGVQGTGHGHLVRSMSMVSRLRELGHDVHCLLTGRAPAEVAGVEALAPYSALRGFTGTVAGGGVRVLATARRLRIPRFFHDVREFDASRFELVVTDYEPASAWIARRHGLPSIGLGHLYGFRGRMRLPGWTGPARLLVAAFAKLYTPVDTAVGLHWHPFGGGNLPPSIPAEVRSSDRVDPEKVLVYLPGEEEAEIVSLLSRVPDVRFVVYRPIAAAVETGNVTLRPYDRTSFVADLADAGGVLSNSGFSLPSEALHLGRRLLVQPIRRHPEQLLNARALRALGLGTVVRRLTVEALRSWLAGPMPEPMNYPDVLGPLARWIDRGDWGRTDALVEETWSQVSWSAR
jgi:uncharacterized protein (TIGR00661 family)